MRLPTRMRYSATISLPTNPTTPAAATQPRWVSGTGSISRRTASTAATTAEIAIIATTNNPARSSTRPKPYVYRRVAARRLIAKAIHSGTAVNASEKLCTVSANKRDRPRHRDDRELSRRREAQHDQADLDGRMPAALSRRASSAL